MDQPSSQNSWWHGLCGFKLHLDSKDEGNGHRWSIGESFHVSSNIMTNADSSASENKGEPNVFSRVSPIPKQGDPHILWDHASSGLSSGSMVIRAKSCSIQPWCSSSEGIHRRTAARKTWHQTSPSAKQRGSCETPSEGCPQSLKVLLKVFVNLYSLASATCLESSTFMSGQSKNLHLMCVCLWTPTLQETQRHDFLEWLGVRTTMNSIQNWTPGSVFRQGLMWGSASSPLP